MTQRTLRHAGRPVRKRSTRRVGLRIGLVWALLAASTLTTFGALVRVEVASAAPFATLNAWEGFLGTATTGASQVVGDNGGATGCASTNTASSSNSVTGVPAGATIRNAYLYWVGMERNNRRGLTAIQQIDNTVSFTTPGSTTTVTADERFEDAFTALGSPIQYGAYVTDVTSLLAPDPNGTYEVAITGGYPDACALTAENARAWQLIVVYDDPTETQFSQVTLSDGLEGIIGATAQITIDGFEVPNSNNEATLTQFLIQGDNSIAGERGVNSDPLFLNLPADFANETVNGSASEAFGDAIDIDVIEGEMLPGATSLTFTYSSTGDLYLPVTYLFEVATVPGTIEAIDDADWTLPNTPKDVDWLTNDGLIAGQTLNTFDTTSVEGGTISDNGDGTFAYTPPTDFVGVDTFTYEVCDANTGDCDTATVTILIGYQLPPGSFNTLLNGGTVSIAACGLDVTLDVTDETFNNIVYFGGDSFIGSGIHMSNQNGARLGGSSSGVRLNFSKSVSGVQAGFAAQQAEEEFTFSDPVAAVAPQFNSTFGVTTPIVSSVEIVNGGLTTQSNLSDVFGTNTPASFGSDYTATWDLAGATEFTMDHSGPLPGPNSATTGTVYNGTIVNDDMVIACDNAQAGIAKAAGDAVYDEATETFTAPYTYVIENTGGQTLHDVQVIDDLTTRFGTHTAGTPTDGTYTVVSTTISANSADALVANTGYTGVAPQHGFLDGDAGSLAVGESATIEMIVQFKPLPATGPQTVLNIASVSGDTAANNDGTPDGNSVDDSTNGSDPDPNSDGRPDENEPTPLTYEAPPPRIECAAYGGFDVQGAGRFDTFDLSVTPTVFTEIVSTGAASNALAYSIEDGQLYAMRDGDDHLLRLSGDGTVTDLGVPSDETTGLPMGPPPGASRYNIGTADENGNLYIAANNSRILTIVDVSTMTFRRINTTGTMATSDIAWNPVDGNIYWIQERSRILGKLDPATGAVETFNLTGESLGGFQGGNFFNAAGHLYSYDNSGVLRVLEDLVEGGENKRVGTGPRASNNDAAGCGSGAWLTKDVSPLTVPAGGTVTYTFVLSWQGDDPAVGASLDDLLDFPGTYVADSLTVNGSPSNAPLGGTANAYGGTTTLGLAGMTLPANSTTTFTIDVATDPAAPTSDVDNQALLSDLGDDYGDVPSDYPGTALPGDPTPLSIVRPFVCVANQGIIVQTTQGQVFTFDTSTPPYTFDPVTTANQDLNALGYNALDGQLYAISATKRLVRISGDGTVTELGRPTRDTNGEFLPSRNIKLGAMDNEGNLWVGSTNGTVYYRIDIETLEYTRFVSSSRFFGADWAWNPIDDQLYSIQSNSSTNLLKLDPLSGTLTSTAIGGASAGPIGGAWFTPDGVLFAYDNTGRVLRVEDPVAATAAEFVSTGPTSTNNDATGCAFGPQLTKDVAPSQAAPGDTVTYTFEITWNVGQPVNGVDMVDLLDFDATYVANSITVDGTPTNAPLSGTASDTIDGASGAYADGTDLAIYDMTLPANSVTTVTVDVLIGPEPVGFVDNQATLQDFGPLYTDVPSDFPPTAVPGDPTPLEILPQPLLALTKSQPSFVDNDGDGQVSLGDVIEYEFLIENVGNVTITGIQLTDPIVNVDCSALTTNGNAFNDTLEPGDSQTCTGTYQVQQADVDAGERENAATVTGDNPPTGPPLPPVPPSTVVTPINQNPSIQLTKTFAGGGGPFAVGQNVDYSFLIENTGDVQLSNVELTDARLGAGALACGATSIPVGGTTQCDISYIITQQDLDDGQIANTASVTGESPQGVEVSDGDPELVVLQQSPQIELTKTHSSIPTIDADGSGEISAGDTITYTFSVQNTGDVTMTSVVVVDPLIGLSAVVCDTTTLAPGTPPPGGATATCTATYVVTAADALAGQIDNTATATAESPVGAQAQDTDSDTVPVISAASISVSKALVGINGSGGAALDNWLVDDVLNYEFIVTNTGGVTLDPVALSDSIFGAVSCPQTSLASGASTTCTIDYTVLQADVNAGTITNTATATGDAPDSSQVSDTADHTASTTQTPDIEVIKSVSGTAELGATLTYSFAITNTGNVTLDKVTVEDATVGLTPAVALSSTSVSCSPTQPDDTLDPGETATCSVDYVVTASDADAGIIDNTVTSSGEGPGAVPVTDDDPLSTPVAQNPSIDVDKVNAITTDVGPVGISAGDTITYTILITNDGDVTLTSVTFSDDLLGHTDSPVNAAPCDGVDDTLTVGESVTCTDTYVATQADIDSGRIDNTATSTGLPPVGDPPVGSSTSTILVPQSPGIQVTKSLTGRTDVDASGNDSEGDVLTYSVRLENTGNVTLDPVTVDDATLAVTALPITDAACGDTDGALLPTETVTCTFTYTLTQADVDAGTLENTAVGSGQPPGGITPVTDDSTVVTPFQAEPGLSIVKTQTAAVPDPLSLPFDLIYELVVANTGNVTIDNVTVTDATLGLTDLTITAPACGDADGALAPGDAITCTLTYSLSPTDLDNGEVVNSATTVGEPPPAGPPLPPVPPSEVTTPLAQQPLISLVKTGTPPAVVAVGEVISYTFDVTNDGNVTVFDVAITDPIVGAITCPDTSAGVATGDTVQCTATQVLTQADIDAGQVVNTATATATPPPTSGPVPPATDDETVPLDQAPDWSFVKNGPTNADEDGSTTVSLGDTLTYTFDVENLGNVTINNVVIDDPRVGLVSCPATTLLPGESILCLADYVVTQADVDTGEIVNTALVTGDPPPGGPPLPPQPPSMVTTPIPTNPDIDVLKRFASHADDDGDGVISVGDRLLYEFDVENTGDVTLSSISVTDTIIATTSCPATTLAPGETTTCTGSYIITQADVDAGEVVNEAFVTGVPPNGPPVDSPPSDVTTPINQNPSLNTTKAVTANADGDGSGTVTEGDELTYTITLMNDGNVTLDPVAITDATLGVTAATCGTSSLAPGASTSCDLTYTVPLADVNAGQIVNVVVGTGTPPNGLPPVVDDDTVTTMISQSSDLTLDKTSVVTDNDDDGLTEPGDVVTYTVTATNTGSVTLTDVSISDPLPGLGAFNCVQPTTLAPTEALVCNADYTITQADVDAGGVDNVATGDGTPPPGGPPLTPPTADEMVPIDRVPALDLTKVISDAPPDPAVDDVITYTFTIENTGNVTLDPVSLTDTKLGLAAASCGATALSAGDSTTCDVTYTVTQADIDAGAIANTATATGTPPAGLSPVNDDDTSNQVLAQNPSITLAKTVVNNDDVADGVLSENDTLTYTFEIENDGDVTLADVTLTDTLAGLGPITCAPTLPADFGPGDTATCTADYTVTAADVAAAEVVNDATVTGLPPLGPPVEANDSKIQTPTESPSISLTKSAILPDADPSVDDVIAYEFVLENTGNVTLTSVGVTDTTLPDLSAIDCGGVTSLAVGATVTCTATYTITQTDIDAGLVENTATATGTSPQGEVVTDDDDERIVPNQSPDLTITKTLGSNDDADGNSSITAGDTLTYDFVLENTGNVTLTGVTYSDPLLGITDATCGGVSALGVGESTTCQATYVVTQDDVDGGEILNTATGTAVPPVGPPLTPTDDETVVPAQITDLDLVKSLAGFTDNDSNSAVTLGDVLHFEFLVTNTGTVRVFDMTVDDPLVASVTCPDTSAGLSPNGSITCTADFTVVLADVNNGSVVNTATATGTPPPGAPPLDPPTSEVTTPIDQTPSITVTKTSDAAAAPAAGEVITYTFEVVNDGNVTLDPVVVSDPLPGLSAITCDLSALDPQQLATCTAAYTIVQADVDAGQILNTATATGTPPAGPPVNDDGSVLVAIAANPQISLDKSTPTTLLVVDDTVVYTFAATNDGNVTLDPVTVTDPLSGLSAVTCDATALDPGQTATCDATYVVTQTDVDNGILTNTATTSGVAPSGATVTGDDTVEIDEVPNPAITIDKQVEGGIPATIADGDVITYVFAVENTGNQTLTDVSVNDPLSGLSAPVCGSTTLAPAETTTCTATFTVTPAAVAAGNVTNTATALGTPPGGPPVESPPDTVTLPNDARIGTAKRVTAGPTNIGAGRYSLTYDIEIVNGGNVPLANVQIVEDLAATFAEATSFTVQSTSSADLTVNGGFDGSADTNLLAGTDTLPVAEGGSVELIVIVTPGADRGPYLNTAIGRGTPPVGPEVEDPSDSGGFGCNSPCDSTDPDDPHPGQPGDSGGSDDPTPVTFANGFDLSLEKGFDAAASSTGTAVWTITIANDGDEAAPAPITVTDELVPGLQLTSSTTPADWTCSAAGQLVTCTGSSDIAPGTSISITLVTSIADSTAAVTNTAQVASVQGIAVESDGSNNSDTAAAPGGLIPFTGSGLTLPLVRIGLAAIVAGCLLWWFASRRVRPRISS